MISEPDRNSRKVALLFWGADDATTEAVSDLVRRSGHSLECERSYADFEIRLRELAFDAIVIDIDSLSIANRDVARIASANPQLPIICISENRLHPDLEESIRKHILACVSKPIDPDELDYWLKCIRTDGGRVSHP
jgi:CheY-like chemotaxis protein